MDTLEIKHSRVATPPRRHEPSGAGTGLVRALSVTLALCVGVFLFGFTLFASTVMRDNAPAGERADGIVVLTGGDFRIVEGAKLLKNGSADRLLISGVNPQTSQNDLIKLSGLPASKFACCVDLGYAAQDTLGNAEEARTWAQSRKASRLIVVTSSYHMPRSLAELAIAMPETELIAHSVVPITFRNRAWWLQPTAARVMLSEYLKYLPVAARLHAMRLVNTWNDPTVTTVQPGQPATVLGKI
jgi:uncharacterized SAM-binding protein YcdF (DUF218 family)